MRVLVSGASGLIGQALIPYLASVGYTQIIRLVRQSPGKGEIFWDPETGRIDPHDLEGFDAVIHLAGESIADGKWTPEKKRRIKDSRVKGTRLLCGALAKTETPPPVLISASGIGYYGNRGDVYVSEVSSSGWDFLADVCKAWESATEAARQKGIRVVNIRLGMVLSPKGGALGKMLLPFKLGLGGKIGDGTQYVSWITLDDVVSGISHMLTTTSISGPVNFVTPYPVTNAEFTEALGRALFRPTLAPLPAWAARMIFGEMADALLLSSIRAEPVQLQKAEYQFLHPQLYPALRHLFGKS